MRSSEVSAANGVEGLPFRSPVPRLPPPLSPRFWAIGRERAPRFAVPTAASDLLVLTLTTDNRFSDHRQLTAASRVAERRAAVSRGRQPAVNVPTGPAAERRLSRARQMSVHVVAPRTSPGPRKTRKNEKCEIENKGLTASLLIITNVITSEPG